MRGGSPYYTCGCGEGTLLALPLGQHPCMDAARQVAPQHSQHLLSKLACERFNENARYKYGVAHAHARLRDRQSLSSTETARPVMCGPWPA